MFRTSRSMVAFIQFSIFVVTIHHAHCEYLGKFLGKLSELHHGVSGEVYAVDAHTLHLKDFTYDGQGPAAYFYAGNTRSPGSGGFKLRDENGNPEVIRRYRKESVTLTLPEGKTLSSIKWFSVWCEEFSVNFGDVKIPRNFDYPRPRKIDALKGVHKITSDNVVVVDAQTLLIPNLSYDGEAPDAKFWVGKGPKPSPQGVRVPDENGKEVPLRRYDQKTVVLTLPGDITVFDIDYFGIWCEAFTVDFGHILIPKSLNIPPSLKMLGISPQKLTRGFNNNSEVPRRRTQLVGGHLEATTFRPNHFRQFVVPSIYTERRADLQTIDSNVNRHHEVVNRAIYNPVQSRNPNLINPPQIVQKQVVQPNTGQHVDFRYQPQLGHLSHGFTFIPQQYTQQVQREPLILTQPRLQPLPNQQNFQQTHFPQLSIVQQQLGHQLRQQPNQRSNSAVNEPNFYYNPFIINRGLELARPEERRLNFVQHDKLFDEQQQLQTQLSRQFNRFVLPNNPTFRSI